MFFWEMMHSFELLMQNSCSVYHLFLLSSVDSIADLCDLCIYSEIIIITIYAFSR